MHDDHDDVYRIQNKTYITAEQFMYGTALYDIQTYSSYLQLMLNLIYPFITL